MQFTQQTNYDIAVLIPHFNNYSGLIRSIRTIKSVYQVLIIVIDDGSQFKIDLTEVNKFEFEVVILSNHENKGIEFSLNRGLKYIIENFSVPFIARLDCGDLMSPERLDKQYKFMSQNPEINLLGSWVDFFSGEKKLYRLRFPAAHGEISKAMMLRVCFIHPAVMFRTDVVSRVGYYPLNYPAAEDYAFFMKVLSSSKTANIQEVLTLVESNPDGISLSKRNIQLRSRMRIVWKYRGISPYFVLGIIKLFLLMIIPYKLILLVKKQIYT